MSLDPGVLTQLENAARLNRDGVLSDAEFAAVKGRLLAGGAQPGPSPPAPSVIARPASRGGSAPIALVASLALLVVLAVAAWAALLWFRPSPKPVATSRPASTEAQRAAASASGLEVALDKGVARTPPLIVPAPSAAPSTAPAPLPTAPPPRPAPSLIAPAAPPLAAASGAGPSFDCGRVSSWSALSVCADPGLAAADRRLASAFRVRAAGLDPASRAALNGEEVAWLRRRDACRGDADPPACLRAAYRDRIAELGPAGRFARSAPPRADRGPPPVIANPDWVRRPSGEELEDLFPEAALRASLSGYTRMRCGVTREGRVVACRILSETPPGLGFAAAALRAAALFRMRPETVDGEPVGGGSVVIPIRWTAE